jgi:carbonic anhydrase
MRIYHFIQLLILIFVINCQNLNTLKENKVLQKSKIPLPYYPKNSNNDDSNENENGESNNSNPTKDVASGVTFSTVAEKYYGLSQTSSNSKSFLQYPEPNNGWDDDELCQNSAEQSPINIPYETDLNIIKDESNVQFLSLDYNYLTSGVIQYQQNHAWGIGILDGGNCRIRIDKTEYTFYLSEVYFHLNSEHKLQDKQFPLEMQLVHYRDNYQNSYEKLIISVLFDYTNNKENDLLKELKIGLNEEIQNADFSEILQKSKSFYYYKGGLTIPPCSKNVHWIILNDIHDMSYDQFKTIKNWIEGSNKYYYNTGYGNARGVKPLNGRKIYYETKMKAFSKSSNSKFDEYKKESGEIIYMKNVSIIMFCLLFLF